MKKPVLNIAHDITDEEIDAAIRIIEAGDDYLMEADTRLYWRPVRHIDKKTGKQKYKPGDLHYYEKCYKLYGFRKQNKIEAMYLVRRFVSHLICKKCARRKQKENIKEAAHFIRVSSAELSWTEREVSEKKKKKIDELFGGDTNGSIEEHSQTKTPEPA